MARQFIRSYSLAIIGKNNTKIITQLRIVFEITKSMRSYPNLAKIDIYNPAPDTMAIIENEDPLIALSAGYKGNIGLIFKGRIRNIFNNKRQSDRILTIYAGDGEQDWQEATFNKTLTENINLNDIMLELFNTFNITGDVTVGTVEGVNVGDNRLLGQTLSGSSKDILDSLANDYNFQWSIQDGEINVVNENKSLSNKSSVIIKQTTGMIGTPTVTEIGADVTTLLNPELLPNRSFTIESESQDIALSNLQFRKVKRTRAAGKYKGIEVLFTGDTHGTPWYSTVRGLTGNV